MLYYSYNTKSYYFEEILKDMFGVNDLSILHQISNQSYKKFTVDTDQSSEFHKIFYKKMKQKFIKEYKKFIKQEIAKLYKDKILFQKYPTFRISLPGNVAVGGYHKDSDYNHNPLEVNYFLPFTKSFETNTVWYLNENKSYAPMNCNPGQFVEWNGATTMHGNKSNTTDKTRVSIDFRTLKLSDYERNKNIMSSITNNMQFKIGKYWEILE